MSRRLNIVYALDSAGSAHAGGLVSADRITARLRKHHDITSIGVGGDVSLQPLLLPVGRDLVAQSSFTFARPDTEALRRALSRADVLHVQLPFFLGFRAVRIAEELGVPIVAGHHVQPENVLAGISFKFPRLGKLLDRPRVAGWINRLVVHTFYNRANAVICPSPLARGELMRAGLTALPVIISNGAPDEFAPAPRQPGGPFTILSVGRLVPETRHDVIIEAARRSRFASQLRVVIAGKGPLEQRLRGAGRRSPLADRAGLRQRRRAASPLSVGRSVRARIAGRARGHGGARGDALRLSRHHRRRPSQRDHAVRARCEPPFPSG